MCTCRQSDRPCVPSFVLCLKPDPLTFLRSRSDSIRTSVAKNTHRCRIILPKIILPILYIVLLEKGQSQISGREEPAAKQASPCTSVTKK